MCDKIEKEGGDFQHSPKSEHCDRPDSFTDPVDSLAMTTTPTERKNEDGASPVTGGHQITDDAKKRPESPSTTTAGPGDKPQFYIEVDASAMVNLKAGTQYTLVPVDSEQAAAAAAAAAAATASASSLPSADLHPPQALSWGRTMDGKIPDEDGNGNPREGPTKEELPGDAFGLDQTMLNGFEPTPGQASKHERSPETSPALDADFESSAPGDCADKEMTYTPLVSVHQQQQQQQQQQHDAAAVAAATAHLHSAGYETLRYRHPSPPMYVAPQQHTMQHQTPFLVHPRGAWTPFPSTAGPQFLTRSYSANEAYLTPVLQPTNPNTSGGSGSGLSAGTSGTTSDGGLHGTLGGEDVSSPQDFGRVAGGDAAGNDLMGVARVANMGQIQHMVGPLDNVPYYMPFNGRENHNEKERKRRTRIKNACQTLRSLVPGLSEKTDKATVFEFTVQYLLHLRRHLGAKHDKSISQEFMEKYSPY